LNQEESMRSRLRQVVAAPPLVLAALWGGCRDLPPTTPRAAPDAPSRDWTSEVEWHAVGSFDIPVPIQGAIPWTSTGITVNDTGWVRVQVTGGVVLEFNKDYKAMCAGPTYLQPPFCPMGAPLAGASLGPDGRRDFDDYLAVMVGIDRGSGPEFVTTGWFTDSPGFFGGVVHGPGTIMVARRDLGWTINGLSPFDVKGQESIQVDVIGPAEACPTGGTSSTFGIRAAATDCVPEPGKTPGMVLTCPDTVMRGSEMDCNVAFIGGSGSVTGWTFLDDASHSVSGPTSGTRWGGVMVIGGTMTATGTVEGIAATDTERVEIRARQWPKIQVEAWDLGQGTLTLPPTRYADLGETKWPLPKQLVQHADISTGPNTGWSYIPAPVSGWYIPVYISAAFHPGSDFYNLQHWGYTPNGAYYCTKAEVPALEAVARAHEGLTHAGFRSHIDAFRDYFQQNDPQQALEGKIVFGADLTGFTVEQEIGQTWKMEVSNASYFSAIVHHVPSAPGGVPGGTVPIPPAPCELRFR
jgi:hypothetical protein